MTLYGTPAGTILNQTGGFQGTQPGNAVGATLQVVNPGVGLFPPNSNNNSGDSILASAARGACPAGVLITNFGLTSSGGRPVLETLGTADASRTSPDEFTGFGGSAPSPNGGSGSFGAGGLNQAGDGESGEATILPANGPSSAPTISSPTV